MVRFHGTATNKEVINIYMEPITTWKALVGRFLILVRMIFALTITWDFFLTVVVSTSQRAQVLTGLGAVFAPWIVGLWLVVLLGMLVLLYDHAFINTDMKTVNKKKMYLVHGVFVLTIILYASLAILAFLNPLVFWPVVVNFCVNILWSGTLIYFRYKMQQIIEMENK